MGGTGHLDDETIEAVRRRIGIPMRNRQRPHHEQLTEDAFRHFAMGYGDDNPLWCDPEYGAAGVWGSVLGPPMFPLSAGSPVPVSWTPEQQREMAGGDPLGGIGQYLCGERWLFAQPVTPGMQLTKQQCLDAAELKRSEFGGGVGALVSHRVEWRDGAGAVVAARYLDFWHAERDASGAAGKYRGIERPRYTPQHIAEYDRLYEAEEVRGGTPRLWDDVRVGDDLGTIAKGPLTLTDMITYHIGIGWGGYGGGSGKVAYKNRKRVPRFYPANEFGVPDSAQRCHWEDAWAQHLGHPAAYDYGAMRTNWMAQLITNWMGDAAWLWKMSAAVTKFNYLGDAHVVSGSVVGLRREGGRAEADVRVEGRNQRGDVTCWATATVLLPTSAARVTVPPPDLADVPPAVGPGPR
ncbi:MAG TPA: MaoC family dehydratase N-terminal domain-containing protein [Acidimicrobiales bacterium]|nr:MaoC family dehydratase N-terminal domain-containing protein [Acidimicrobiales bacterium]